MAKIKHPKWPDAPTFRVRRKCPNCGNKSLFGYMFYQQDGRHQHTHYVCYFWGSPEDKRDYLKPGYDATALRCGWHGWVVPGWDK